MLHMPMASQIHPCTAYPPPVSTCWTLNQGRPGFSSQLSSTLLLLGWGVDICVDHTDWSLFYFVAGTDDVMDGTLGRALASASTIKSACGCPCAGKTVGVGLGGAAVAGLRGAARAPGSSSWLSAAAAGVAGPGGSALLCSAVGRCARRLCGGDRLLVLRRLVDTN